ncbi:probable cytochrome P450 301a1, mitochondrial [Orussus abietinus]|uniref:probable cytochrome P450 301a1, mitochondrial n=1 Tax=Orussus abietinus TaxID=222816 RepID=UPI0006256F73|nr:probable cytochrome P450 301a1, mitochondrial [Orussus abietinus]XP_012280633.1 probable cytochrome P450 301a1, mitochondrial [Orussus abietinus]XP_012280634.1 probable cytochrome P450 301a1, mitochondrial [Orussus abietinus]XP_012280635.1 probable cytochrome P450 301a1, mitochondrial [Orussus abietinus]XP_023289625.1 probable cytochrome P450 301a1, mitochondrial [Orussus abietinus]
MRPVLSLINPKAARCTARCKTFATFPVSMDRKDDINLTWNNARPYTEIPGPRSLPVIGNVLKFIPYIGEYGDLSLSDQLDTMHRQFGNIVKLEGIGNRRDVVLLFDADLCEKMYRIEGQWPLRIAMETLTQYRKERSETYKGHFGLAVSQGEDWHKFRSRVNQHMMQPRTIKPHVDQVNYVADDFLVKINKLRDKTTMELPETFNNELYKWALESMCVIALEHRMGCLESNLSPHSEPQQMIDDVHTMFDLFYKLEVLPSLWKVYRTPNLKKLFSTLDNINRIIIRHVNAASERLRNSSVEDKQNLSMLQRLLSIDEQTAYVMVMDMLLAGIDTTSNMAGILLYHMATNPEVQEKLRDEICTVLPEKSSPVTFKALTETTYLKACLKESLRIMPIAIGSLRTMQNDVVIGGCQIPKGVDVLACHSTLSRDERYFPNPEMFIPERWLRDNASGLSAKTAHPFAYMPFGFGPRMCIGRRFAELEIETLAMKVIRNFKLEWDRGPLQIKSRFINTINSPLQLKLIDV